MALYRLSADELRRWVKRHPELGERFRRRFDLQLTMAEWGKHQLTTLDVDALLRAGRQERARKGQTIFAPGDAADAVFLVVDGAVELELPGRGRARRERLVSGQVFGEVETLGRKPRLATARALTATTLLRLDLGAAAEVLQHFDIVQRQLLAIAARREAARLGTRRHR
jgi:CRP-like cAMP-binding protein